MSAPSLIEMDVEARTVPVSFEDAPSVAELPTCQKMWHAWAPPVSTTELSAVVPRVEPACRTKTAFGSPPASRVRTPASDSAAPA
jgi:hypothetical protein